MHAAELSSTWLLYQVEIANYNWFVEKYLLLRYIVVSIVILCVYLLQF